MIKPGDRKKLAVYAPGGPVNPNPIGWVDVIVLSVSGGEADVILDPRVVDNVWLMEGAITLFKSADVDLKDLRQGRVYVIANMNTAWLHDTI